MAGCVHPQLVQLPSQRPSGSVGTAHPGEKEDVFVVLLHNSNPQLLVIDLV